MHRSLTCVAVLSLVATLTAHADALDSRSPLRSGPTVDVGFSWGGQNLNRPDFAGNHVIGTYRAGEGVSAGVGMVELFGGDSGFGLKQELGAWVQYPLGDQDVTSVEMVFFHAYFNALAFYHRGDWAVGGGATYQGHVQNQDGGGSVLSDEKNALGLILMCQYRMFSLRYTRIQYHVKNIAPSPALSGSNVGIYLNYPF
jgi:hypothetical protein